MHQPPADAVARILAAMERNRVSRDDLVALGIGSRNALHQVFCRRKPLTPSLKVRLAQALGMTLDELEGPATPD